MVIIPVNAEPNQRFSIVLDNQNCTFELYQRYDRLYATMYVDDVTIISGVICLDCVSLIQTATTAFSGFICFVDTLGNEPPQWEGLGDRWQLVFFTAQEVAEIVSS